MEPRRKSKGYREDLRNRERALWFGQFLALYTYTFCTFFFLSCYSLAAPGDDTSSPTTALTIPSDLNAPSAFTDVLAQVSKKDENAYSSSRLPPTPPFKKPHHILKIQKGAVPHDPHAYYPAENYA
jgi:hypothetical protein